MNSKVVIVGLAILIVIVAVISLSVPSEQPVGDSGDNPYSQCVDDALKDAENCLLSGGSDCKANGEKALDACKK